MSHTPESEQTKADKKDGYHHGDLRAALIDAALQVVSERGLSGLSIRGLARRVGVTHSAPYRHFDDKDALIAAMAEAGFYRLRTYMNEAIEECDEPRARFRASGLAYVRFAVDNAPMFRVMFCSQARNFDDYPQLAEAHEVAFRILVGIVEECQAAGEIHPGPSETPAYAAWSVVQGLASLFVNGIFDASEPDSVTHLFDKCGGELIED